MLIRRRTNRSFIIILLLLSQLERNEKREKRNRTTRETTLSRARSLPERGVSLSLSLSLMNDFLLLIFVQRVVVPFFFDFNFFFSKKTSVSWSP